MQPDVRKRFLPKFFLLSRELIELDKYRVDALQMLLSKGRVTKNYFIPFSSERGNFCPLSSVQKNRFYQLPDPIFDLCMLISLPTCGVFEYGEDELVKGATYSSSCYSWLEKFVNVNAVPNEGPRWTTMTLLPYIRIAAFIVHITVCFGPAISRIVDRYLSIVGKALKSTNPRAIGATIFVSR